MASLTLALMRARVHLRGLGGERYAQVRVRIHRRYDGRHPDGSVRGHDRDGRWMATAQVGQA